MLEIGEIVTSKGKNKICTLKRARDTRWGSLSSICSLKNIYETTFIVSRKFAKERLSYVSRGDAHSAYNYLKVFDFILILYLMKEIMGITNIIFQALQRQSEDVANVMILICTTKSLIQELRENGWDKLFTSIQPLCEKYDVEIPNLNNVYSITRFECSHLEDN